MAKFSILATLGLDSGRFLEGARRSQTAGGKLAGFMKGALVAGFVAAGAAVVAFVGKGIKDFIDMEKKAREVFTLIPNASNKMRKELVEGAREISKEFGAPITDVLQGMYSALSAGIPKENVVDFLKVAGDAAKGGVASLSESVAAITTVLNGYGMEASKARDVSDVLFTTVKGGVTTFSEMGAEVGKVTPIASALGIEFSDVGAMFADLTAKLGDGKTGVAGTQISAMLSELAKSGSKADKIFKDLTGTSFPEFTKNGGNVKDALMAMKDSADANGLSMIDMFGSLEAGKAALNFTKEGAEGLTKALKDQEDRMGSTKVAADEMKESFGERLARAGQEVNDIFRRVGEVLMNLGGGSGGIIDMLMGYVKMLVTYLEDASNSGGGLKKAFEVLGVAMKFLIKVAGTQINVFKMIISVAQLLMQAMSSVGKIVMAVFNPLFEVIQGASAIIAAFAVAVSKGLSPSAWVDFKNTVGKELGDVEDAFSNWGKNINETFEKESKNMSDAWNGFSNDIKHGISEIGDIWDEAGNWEFLDEEKMKAKALKESAEEAKKIAEEQKITTAEIKKQKELAEQQKKLLLERIAKVKAMKKIEAEIKADMEKMKSLAERVKMLQGKKVELSKKQAERQKEINNLISKEATLHNDALGIVDKLLAKTNLRNRDERRLLEIKARLKKDAQVANDATEEGIKKLKAHRAALILIKETETEIRKDKMRQNGLSEKMIEFKLKEDKILQQIDKGIAGTNNRLKKAGEHQEKFNKKLPPAKVMVGKVAMGARELNGEIKKAKDEQARLTTKTKESVEGFKAMGGEAKEIEEGLRSVGEEMESMKFGVDDMELDMSDAENLPEHMKEANVQLDEFNKKSSENDLVKLANVGEIKVSASSPIPVKIEDFKLDTKALTKMSEGTKQLLGQAKAQTKSLRSIDKTVKGYFINQ